MCPSKSLPATAKEETRVWATHKSAPGLLSPVSSYTKACHWLHISVSVAAPCVPSDTQRHIQAVTHILRRSLDAQSPESYLTTNAERNIFDSIFNTCQGLWSWSWNNLKAILFPFSLSTHQKRDLNRAPNWLDMWIWRILTLGGLTTENE